MRGRPLAVTLCAALAAAILADPPAGAAEVTYLHSLSDFNGTVPYSHVRIHLDRVRNEAYVLEGHSVRVFNDTAMEVHAFGYEPALGAIVDLAVTGGGDLLVLSRTRGGASDELEFSLLRCDYRGRILESRSLDPPPGAPAFRPQRMVVRGDRVLLLDGLGLRLLTADLGGRVERLVDLAAMLEVPPERAASVDISGFDLAEDGTVLLTVPTLFRAFLIAPDGTIRSFGRSGSAPGRFGIVAGIAAGPEGQVYVADKLRSVVMVFDRDLRFVTEFGGYGMLPESLVRPDDLAVDARGRIYVTQLRNRGVSVFEVAP
jgi:hypothetical protein